MSTRIVRTHVSRLPADDDHPYRTGAWRPNFVEYEADELEVIHGAIPAELDGVYLRNTENPVMDSLGRYHPFDGDGMVHAVRFGGGRASYRNRLVPTQGLAAELAAGRPLYAGIIEPPERSVGAGWGARGRLKDASSTDVVVHAGKALTSYYQCGDLYALDPLSLDPLGVADFGGQFPPEGVSAHTKVDEATGELLFFNYSKHAPYMHYGVLDATGARVHYADIVLPGPRLPHDMAFTEHFAIVNDLPLFWEPGLLAQGVHRPRFFRDLPSRFGVIPRRGASSDVRWFEASPTYVLHFINAFERGDEVIVDGFRQENPAPKAAPEEGPWGPLMRGVDMHTLMTRAHRWRFNLRTGQTSEVPLDDSCIEFPMINARFGGRAYRHAYAMTSKPGWFLFDGLVHLDVETGKRQRYAFPDGVYASESPMAPRAAGTAEDDGWVVTFVSDLQSDTSECQIFDARGIAGGPVACLRLPERICSGTHAFWASAESLRAGVSRAGA